MSINIDSKAFETVQDYVIGLYSDHKLEPGDCIYETALAEELGLSRTPVRDALGRLAANGLLEQPHGKRGYRIPSLEFGDMRDAFEARECLEEKIGWLAAEKAQVGDIEQLRGYNEDEIKFFTIDRRMDYIKANDSFHLCLAHIASNPYIERIYAPVYWRTQLYVYYLGTFSEREKAAFNVDERLSDTPHEHAAIIAAITQRDASGAAKCCLAHAQSTFSNRLSKQLMCPPELFRSMLKAKFPNSAKLTK